MTNREMIEACCQQEGYSIKSWIDDEDDGETAVLGRFEVNTADYDNDGLYNGDAGELRACVVGAEQYGNRRVCFSFKPDESDGGVEVRDLFALDPED